MIKKKKDEKVVIWIILLEKQCLKKQSKLQYAIQGLKENSGTWNWCGDGLFGRGRELALNENDSVSNMWLLLTDKAIEEINGGFVFGRVSLASFPYSNFLLKAWWNCSFMCWVEDLLEIYLDILLLPKGIDASS